RACGRNGRGAAAPGGPRFHVGLRRRAEFARQRATPARSLGGRTPPGAAARSREAMSRPWLRLALSRPDQEPHPPLVRDAGLRHPQQDPSLPRTPEKVESLIHKDKKDAVERHASKKKSRSQEMARRRRPTRPLRLLQVSVARWFNLLSFRVGSPPRSVL